MTDLNNILSLLAVDRSLYNDGVARLFCFPYAGGSRSIFRKWANGLPRSIEVFPVELPGRGTRFHEAPCTELIPLVKQIARELMPLLDKPFALFGHSMGAIISFELARLLRADHICPRRLIVSGRGAPHLPQTRTAIYSLAEREFLDALRNLDGTPKEVLDNPELMKVVTPMLRADLQMIETYRYRTAPPLDCPIVIFGGRGDKTVGKEELKAWGSHTTGQNWVHMFPGDHFFLTAAQSLVLERLSRSLQNLVYADPL